VNGGAQASDLGMKLLAIVVRVEVRETGQPFVPRNVDAWRSQLLGGADGGGVRRGARRLPDMSNSW
jgi:hypothetical protein